MFLTIETPGVLEGVDSWTNCVEEEPHLSDSLVCLQLQWSSQRDQSGSKYLYGHMLTDIFVPIKYKQITPIYSRPWTIDMIIHIGWGVLGEL